MYTNAAGVIAFGYKAFIPSGKAWHTNYLPKTHAGDGAYYNSRALHPTAEADQQAGPGITPSADGFCATPMVIDAQMLQYIFRARLALYSYLLKQTQISSN